MGTTEAIIILLVALALFGPTLVAFWFGYTLGQRKASGVAPESRAAAPAGITGDAEPDVAAPEDTDRSEGGDLIDD